MMAEAKLFVAGDVVNYTNESATLCSDEMEAEIKAADFAVCNFEAPIGTDNRPLPKSGGHHYQLKETIPGLRRQGFDLLLLANNHIMDFGGDALKETIDWAESNDFECIGAGLSFNQAYKPLVKEINGLSIGFINAGEAQFGVLDYSETSDAGYAWINHREIDNTVLSLKSRCDYVVLFSHAGLENYSIPQNEWRQRYRQLCDLGVDVVVGSHPHVPQGYEKYKGSMIFYSLGNFYFDGGGYAKSKNSSYSIQLTLDDSGGINFSPVHHETIDGKVQLAEEPVDIERLNAMLGSEYGRLHDQMEEELYLMLRKHLANSFMKLPTDGTIKGTIKEIAATLLGRRKNINKPLNQLHFLRNESYRYAVTHALSVNAKNRG